MLTRLSLLLACAAILIPSLAQAQRLLKPHYPNSRKAAVSAAAFAFSKNGGLRQAQGAFNTRRVKIVGQPQRTRTGMLRYKVATRKKLSGTTKPLAEVRVTVRKTKSAWRAYWPGKTRVKINNARPHRPGWRFVGMEDWIEVHGAEGEHRRVPGGVLIPTYNGGE
jgi:hypothetical protein